MSRAVVARLRRASPVFVCRKCLKRSAQGSAVRSALKRKLKRQGSDVRKPPRLIVTSCFGICPKKAIVLASAGSLRKGEYILASRQADLAEALDLLQSS